MPLRTSILKVLAYFDLFNYPVTAEEIRFFLDREIPESDLQAGLERAQAVIDRQAQLARRRLVDA